MISQLDRVEAFSCLKINYVLFTFCHHYYRIYSLTVPWVSCFSFWWIWKLYLHPITWHVLKTQIPQIPDQKLVLLLQKTNSSIPPKIKHCKTSLSPLISMKKNKQTQTYWCNSFTTLSCGNAIAWDTFPSDILETIHPHVLDSFVHLRYELSACFT